MSHDIRSNGMCEWLFSGQYQILGDSYGSEVMMVRHPDGFFLGCEPGVSLFELGSSGQCFAARKLGPPIAASNCMRAPHQC